MDVWLQLQLHMLVTNIPTTRDFEFLSQRIGGRTRLFGWLVIIFRLGTIASMTTYHGLEDVLLHYRHLQNAYGFIINKKHIFFNFLGK